MKPFLVGMQTSDYLHVLEEHSAALYTLGALIILGLVMAAALLFDRKSNRRDR